MLRFFKFRSKDFRIKDGCKMWLVVSLVVGKVETLPELRRKFYWLLSLITNGGDEIHLGILRLESVDLRDKVESFLAGITCEQVNTL